MSDLTDQSKKQDSMPPEVFAQAIVSIEQNYGLKLDARSVWSRMDAIACGRGWVGTKPGCKRGKIGENAVGKSDQKVEAAPIQPISEKKIGAACGKGWEGTKPGCKRIKKGNKTDPNADRKIEPNQQAKPQPKTEFVPKLEPTQKQLTRGGHNDIPERDSDIPSNLEDRISAIQNLTGMSEEKSKSSIDAISNYTSASFKSLVNYNSIRNVQRGIFKSANGKDLSESEISEIQSNIKSIDQYVKKMPAFNGTVHRGISFKSKEDQEAFLTKISGGFSLEAMSSFSSSETVAKAFADQAAGPAITNHGILLTVKNKSGASVQQLSNNESEDEVLVPKDVKYKIVGKPKRSGNLIVVQMEEI